MSKVSERKFVTFLRKLQNGGEGITGTPLSYIENIYTDHPQESSTPNTFPRIQVREFGSTSSWGGFSDTDRHIDGFLRCTIWVNKKDPIDWSVVQDFWQPVEGGTRNLSPEEACGAIADHLVTLTGTNRKQLSRDNDFLFVLLGETSYTDEGWDDDEFKNLAVYKGSQVFKFKMRL